MVLGHKVVDTGMVASLKGFTVHAHNGLHKGVIVNVDDRHIYPV